jgi:hypothetical protein
VKIDVAIHELRDAETELAGELRRVGERHAAEHDVYHLGHALARECATRLAALAPAAARYGASLPGNGEVRESPGIVESLRRTSSTITGRSPAPAMVLLHDLRDLYLSAQKAELAWVVLGQAATAARDAELVDVVAGSRERCEICGKWLRTRIKEAAPQTLVAG